MFALSFQSQRHMRAISGWLAPLGEWPLFVLLGALVFGIVVVDAQPLSYDINIGYEEGWHSDPPFVQGWNTPEPYKATADVLSYRWTADDSRVWLPGLAAQPIIATIHQLAASANPQAAIGALMISTDQMILAQPLAQERMLHLLVPPASANKGILKISAPTFTPPGDPRTLGAPIGGIALRTVDQPIHLPNTRLFWPVLLLPLAWLSARRWCVGRATATIAGAGLITLLLAALTADRLRFAIAGAPLLIGSLWGLALAASTIWLSERYAARLGVRPSPWFVRSVGLVLFWLMTLRYGGRLYPESMIGDLGFHVNRQTEVIGGLIHLVSRHRGIDFPYPSAAYILLAPFRLLPFAPQILIEFADALFGALGVLPVAYIGLRGFRATNGHEQMALFATVVYALLAPAMMALWWSFLAHIFTQEALALLIALLIGMWQRLDSARNVAVMVLALSFVFLGHFGLFINVSLLIALVVALTWLRTRHSDQIRQVRGLALAFVLAELLALGVFYSAYFDLIRAKLQQFTAGGMSAVQGGRGETTWQALVGSLWSDGLVAHYAVIGVPLAVLGGYWLWHTQRRSVLTTLFWCTIAIAVVQGAIPFATASTITTRWLSFCAWVVAIGMAVALHWLWQRGRVGQSVAVIALGWIGGTTLWLWVQALGYRIRPPEPF